MVLDDDVMDPSIYAITPEGKLVKETGFTRWMMAAGMLSIILVTFGLIDLLCTNQARAIASTVDVNPAFTTIITPWMSIPVLITCMGGAAIFIPVIARANKSWWKIIMVIAITLLTVVLYFFMARAINFTSVFFTSPLDPYVERYYVGVTLVGEIDSENIAWSWAIPSGIAIAIAITVMATIKSWKWIDRLDSITGFLPLKKYDVTYKLKCTRIDGKEMCRIGGSREGFR